MYPNLGDLQRVKECHDCTLAICPEKRGLEHVDEATNFNNTSCLIPLVTFSVLKNVKTVHLRVV